MKVHRDVTSILIIFLVTCLLFPCIVKADYPDGYYDVLRVIDGDTFELTNGETVRLTGINTTEIGEECSYEATQELKALIAGKTVYLEKDVSETDIYGRLLRYVYVDATFVNYKLVFDGYAYAAEYPPDVRYATLFADAENDARSHKRGCLWADVCPSGCYVHITATGIKYHSAGCRYLSQSDIRICRDDAIAQGYTPCSVCEGRCDGSGGDGKTGCFFSTTSDN